MRRIAALHGSKWCVVVYFPILGELASKWPDNLSFVKTAHTLARYELYRAITGGMVPELWVGTVPAPTFGKVRSA